MRRRTLPRVALVLALAPLLWLVADGALLRYQEAAGRFFAAAVVLACATFGIAHRRRPVAVGLMAIAITTTALALVNDAKRPSGLRLLEPADAASYFRTPRSAGQGAEAQAADLTRFVDTRVPVDATIALVITPSDPGYVFFGRGLDRRLVLTEPGARDSASATWAFSSPGSGATGLCDGAWETLPDRPQGWLVQRRIPGATCG